jgi:hypothetical protein
MTTGPPLEYKCGLITGNNWPHQRSTVCLNTDIANNSAGTTPRVLHTQLEVGCVIGPQLNIRYVEEVGWDATEVVFPAYVRACSEQGEHTSLLNGLHSADTGRECNPTGDANEARTDSQLGRLRAPV